ncbi:MAG: hypothetical protein M3Q58_09265 [Bacteroidota bacterium]|nr:hypothetical protein [Bacteroidota bacterium]
MRTDGRNMKPGNYYGYSVYNKNEKTYIRRNNSRRVNWKGDAKTAKEIKELIEQETEKTIADDMINTISSCLKIYNKNDLRERLMKLFKLILKQYPVKKGLANYHFSLNEELFHDFNFNRHNPYSDVFPWQTPPKKKKTALKGEEESIVKIAREAINAPQVATHFCMIKGHYYLADHIYFQEAGIYSHIDNLNGEFECSQTRIIPLDEEITTVELKPLKNKAKTDDWFIKLNIVGIEFFKQGEKGLIPVLGKNSYCIFNERE